MIEYAVYTEAAFNGTTYDSDMMDWYDTKAEAIAAAKELAADGETAYVAEVQGGDFGDDVLTF